MSGAAMGRRQMGGAGNSHHQRRYSSDQVEYSRLLSMQRGISGEFPVPVEPTARRLSSQSSSQRQHREDVYLNGHSPGLLDLHSIDTELLPQAMPHSSGCSGETINFTVVSAKWPKKTEVAELLPSRRNPVPLQNNLLKSLSADKEKTSSVAKIKVVVRKRPLNKKEIAKKEEDIITIDSGSSFLTVHEMKLKASLVDLTEYLEKHEFVFDAVLDEDVSNDEVYRETVEPTVPAIFQRTKATCFAYGQTGKYKCSGKTYTMQPLPLKASQDILRLMHHTYRYRGFQLYVSLQEFRVSNVDSIRELIEKGNATRSTGTTGANEESSRSHAILQLAIKRSVVGSESKPARIVGKLSFIDLAGSERGADTTDNDKQTRIEGAEINKSLLALKECIRALDNDQVHIPFRGSKLTEVLRDSFVGDSRTVMISCISPNSGSCEHTLNTLRYADRVKSLSKGNNKKDLLLATTNLRESTMGPLSSVLPAFSGLDNESIDISSETHPSHWSKQFAKESSLQYSLDHVPSGRDEYSKHSRVSSRGSSTVGVLDSSVNVYEQAIPSRKERKADAHRQLPVDSNMRIDSHVNQKYMHKGGVDDFGSDDALNALLQEEEDLIVAHRRQVEDTINIVTEEMNLLDEAEQPGNQLDEYVSRLNAILSKKAAGIVSLQAQLAHFCRRLAEQNVLVS
ncbi:kinesin motor domain containing protein [Musa troglodytarum]|uniref:Kinesin-like protein n=1 Tax=Musa troglodytarum TaxID=320322 RepID=A0A9E7KHX0_9LILI|nr:kinesin motor domain containing protein [Musa troglodytarum]